MKKTLPQHQTPCTPCSKQTTKKNSESREKNPPFLWRFVFFFVLWSSTFFTNHSDSLTQQQRSSSREKAAFYGAAAPKSCRSNPWDFPSTVAFQPGAGRPKGQLYWRTLGFVSTTGHWKLVLPGGGAWRLLRASLRVKPSFKAAKPLSKDKSPGSIRLLIFNVRG